MVKKKLLAAAVFSMIALGSIGVTAASAGEITGNGRLKEVKANSECAFSGLEDEPHNPGTTQNWGQIPKEERDFLVSIGVSPSELCNGSKNPIK